MDLSVVILSCVQNECDGLRFAPPILRLGLNAVIMNETELNPPSWADRERKLVLIDFNAWTIRYLIMLIPSALRDCSRITVAFPIADLALSLDSCRDERRILICSPCPKWVTSDFT